jgi:hypothetical protein
MQGGMLTPKFEGAISCLHKNHKGNSHGLQQLLTDPGLLTSLGGRVTAKLGWEEEAKRQQGNKLYVPKNISCFDLDIVSFHWQKGGRRIFPVLIWISCPFIGKKAVALWEHSYLMVVFAMDSSVREECQP